MHYLQLLRRLHEEVRPAGYLEIGVDWGDSLQLSRARSVAIDPAPKPRPQSLLGKPGMLLYVGTSDDFFREHERGTILRDAPLDLVFIDGLHEFAQVVRDLENVERWSHPETVVAIHDILPRTAWEAAHAFHDGFWTGDVWRLVPFLRKHRPDLRLWLTQAEPTGMLVVTGCDPGHHGMSSLAEADEASFPPAGPDYDRLVEAYIAEAGPEPAETVLRALGLERRLARDWEYDTKWGMRRVADSCWRPLLEAAAALPHTEQHRDGLRACLRLINAHWLPEGVREQAYGHMTAYAELLTTLWPEASVQPLTVAEGDLTTIRWPCSLEHPGGLGGASQSVVDDRGTQQWAPFLADAGHHVVSWWEPTEILHIADGSDETRRVALRPAPRIAERFRSASAGISVPGGWLFLVNEPTGSLADTQATFARFVFIRSDFHVTAVSPHFWVTARGEDAAHGLTRLGDDVIASFTAGGGDATLARVSLAAVVASLLPVESAGLSVSHGETA
jgi:hypothetical protein